MTTSTARMGRLAEPLGAFLTPPELAARETLQASLGVDVARTYQFWEAAVARILGGARLTAHKCGWDVELDLPDGDTIRVEVKFSQEQIAKFANGSRPVMRFAAPKGEKVEKAADVIVLVGIDVEDVVHAWAVPIHRVRLCRSITLTSPRVRTGLSRSGGLDWYYTPPTMLLPDVLRAYREVEAHRADQD